MDFYTIKQRSIKKGVVDIFPDFKITRSKDLLVRGKSFYAIWDEEKKLWSEDEYDVQVLVDKELWEYKSKIKNSEDIITMKLMSEYSSNSWSNFKSYIKNLSDNSHDLNMKIMFSNQETKKSDYASKKVPYALEKNDIPNYTELMNTLYDEEERLKLEWAIGSVISGDSKNIQKFITIYGDPGTGKSTFFNLLSKLFQGYWVPFDAQSLVSNNKDFATESFKTNPLVAIQHDTDLSKMEDNSKFNSIISHEVIEVNEKFKSKYPFRFNCFLFIGTNKPVKISDGKSGLLRRLIDVKPSGRTVPVKRYHTLVNGMDFELGGIAYHCLETYNKMGKNYYSSYRPLDMILKTDIFFNYVESNYYQFKKDDGVSLTQAYELYKNFCDESNIEHKIAKFKFREELKNYFKTFSEMSRIDNKQIRSYYSGFLKDKFKNMIEELPEHAYSLTLDSTKSLLDEIATEYFAQYANSKEIPTYKWDKVTTKLKTIDTTKIHYLKLPKNHIVIDFDLKDENGNKSLEKNIEAASNFPTTYAEISKGGNGIHLHYIYKGDVEELSSIYSEGIEVKVFIGNSSLRRRLTLCNDKEIASISDGLPKKVKKTINLSTVEDEKHIRNLLLKALHKEIHANTKPNIDFINKILEEANNKKINYDVTDLRPRVLDLALSSTHQTDACLKILDKMPFKYTDESLFNNDYEDDTIVFFDVEVYPNFVLVVFKKQGKIPVSLINPKAIDLEQWFKFKLVGFNNRRYDNHILYAIYMNYSTYETYLLSQKIINGSNNALFTEAYNIGYTDIYDFSSKKQSLKQWEIELRIKHNELNIPWDQPVTDDQIPGIVEYCIDDVNATEALFDHLKEDFSARLLLSELSGLTPNHTTQQHTAKIIFGNEQNPKKNFIYTDLSVEFPGYNFDAGKSTYRDECPGEGGYVYAEPGIYNNVLVLDVESMHPTSAIKLNIFGPYTNKFKELLDARLAIKHKNFKSAEKMLNGALSKYLKDTTKAKELSYALKIIINSVYGYTSAKFDNKFRDLRNKDNIVAKRGSLFMINLKHEVQNRGCKVIHIKTDSIKIVDPSKEIIDFIIYYGKKYGYNFEVEDVYKKIALVNNAVYIAQKEDGTWSATGTEFAEPYVFKTLFSKEKIIFEDYCETKTVTTSMYLSFDNGRDLRFVGKVGLFTPVKKEYGGDLFRESIKEGVKKYDFVTGTKGYKWLESAKIMNHPNINDIIDESYYKNKVDKAIKKISEFGDLEQFKGDKNE